MLSGPTTYFKGETTRPNVPPPAVRGPAGLFSQGLCDSDLGNTRKPGSWQDAGAGPRPLLLVPWAPAGVLLLQAPHGEPRRVGLLSGRDGDATVFSDECEEA